MDTTVISYLLYESLLRKAQNLTRRACSVTGVNVVSMARITRVSI